MQPEEIAELKKEMGKVFVQEFRKVDFRELIRDVCEEIITKKNKEKLEKK